MITMQKIITGLIIANTCCKTVEIRRSAHKRKQPGIFSRKHDFGNKNCYIMPTSVTPRGHTTLLKFGHPNLYSKSLRLRKQKSYTGISETAGERKK